MYNNILLAHSLLRFFILISLLLVIVLSLQGWLGKKPFTQLHNRSSLYLLIFTHLQLVVGLIVYFLSPWVRFDNTTMKDAATRYWTVEHIFAMLIVVALITIGRVSSKRLASDEAKHRRLFVLNTVALILIIATLSMSGRGLFGVTPQ